MFKKIIYSILLFIFLFCISSNVEAALKKSVRIDGFFDANIKIAWYDYDNAEGIRPESLDLVFYGETEFKNTTATVTKDMCDTETNPNEWDCIVRVNGVLINVGTIRENYDEKYSFSSVSDGLPSNYEVRDSLSSYNYKEEGYDILYNEGTISIVANVKRDYYFNVTFNDDNNRDGIRPWGINYNLSNQDTFNKTIEIMTTTTDMNKSDPDGYTYSQKNWQYIANLLPYLNNGDGTPNFNAPATYTITPIDIITEYEYNLENNDNEYNITYNYTPQKLGYDVNVNVIFEENIFKKPDNLNIKLITENDSNGTEITLNDDNNFKYTFKNLYLNDVNLNPDTNHIPKPAKYMIDIEDSKDYEYEISGNQEEGFTILVKYVGRKEYEVIEGANQKFYIDEDGNLSFRINADYELFKDGGKVYVDDKLVNEKYYTSKSGSTIITFNKKFTSSLSIGSHILKVVFNNGGVSTTTFNVLNKESEEVLNENSKETDEENTTNSLDNNNIVNDKNPSTSDNIYLNIVLLILSSIGLISIKFLKKIIEL